MKSYVADEHDDQMRSDTRIILDRLAFVVYSTLLVIGFSIGI